MEDKYIAVLMDRELQDEFKITCIRAGKSMKQVVAELIRGYTNGEIEI